MKRIILILFIISSSTLCGQIIIIKDSISDKEIANVTLQTINLGQVSSLEGKVDISRYKNNEIIEVSHISYVTKKIYKQDITDSKIYLQQKTNLLPVIDFNTELKVLISEKYEAQQVIPSGFSELQSTVSNLLASASSVVVQESQPGGGSPNYRGMEANRLLLIIDGVTLNNAIFRSGHLQNSGTINPFFIKSISILSGPASVGYGNGAMGGALIFTTKYPNTKDKVQFLQQFESNSNSSITNFLINYHKKNHSHLTAFSVRSVGNLIMGNNRLHKYTEWGKESIVTENNKQLYTNYSQVDLLHKSTVKINDYNNILLNTQYSKSSEIYRFDKMNDISNDLPKYLNWTYGPRLRFMQSMKHIMKYKTVAFDSISTVISYQDITESRHVQKLNEDLFNNRKENLNIYDLNIDFKKKLKIMRLSYGLGIKNQNINSRANLSNNNNNTFYNTTRYPSGGSTMKELFAYTQININLSRNIDLLLGGRLNNSRLNARFNDDSYFTDIENYNRSFIKSILVSFKPIKSTIINASYYNGFRNPNIDDIGKIFSKDGENVVVPNKDLMPEYANNFEIEINYKINRIKLQLQLFNTSIDNAITRQFGTLNGSDSIFYDGEKMRIQMNKNIEGAIINGISFTADFKIIEKIKLNSSLNYLKGLTNEGDPLAHIPPLNAKINLSYEKFGHNITCYAIYNAWKFARDYDKDGVDNIKEATARGNPSWLTLNMAYYKKITDEMTFKIAIQNITDLHYKTFGSGLSAGGRNYVIAIQTEF